MPRKKSKTRMYFTEETEEAIKKQTKASIRCIPLEPKEEHGKCVFSGNPSKRRVLFAKAY